MQTHKCITKAKGNAMIKITANTRAINARPISILTLLANGMALARQRRKLARLDASALFDMGISQAEALTEAQRPSWDAPKNWRL